MFKLVFLTFLFPLVIKAQNEPVRTANFPKETIIVKEIPKKAKVWVFIMAGQSNMAGRGFVEPQDTIPNHRILTINKENQLIEAKEPLHFYQPNLAGLDCGISFAKGLISKIDTNVVILLLPCAVGGSQISFWLNDSLFNGVRLKSNFIEKVELAKKFGILKGILWHQGESDAFSDRIPLYENKLRKLLIFFRECANNNSLPIIMGELGSYSRSEATKLNWFRISQITHKVASSYKNCMVVNTSDLKSNPDFIHFNSLSQRILGRRYADAFLSMEKTDVK